MRLYIKTFVSLRKFLKHAKTAISIRDEQRMRKLNHMVETYDKDAEIRKESLQLESIS